MGNELVLFDSKFNLKENKILYYLYENTETVLKTDGERFIFCFTELYRLPIFKSLLDAILTELKNKNAKFILKPLKNWDRVAGHCETKFVKNFDRELIGQESSFKNGFFSKSYTIVIKKFTPDIVIHEIGHAIEHISGIDINGAFRKNFAADMQTWSCVNRGLDAAVKDVMQKQLKNYPLTSTMAELFARFFEMLAMSKEVGGWGDYQFTYAEASRFFYNTIGWVQSTLEDILAKKIDREISSASAEFVANLEPYKKKWTEKIKSRFANTENPNKKFQELFSQDSMNRDRLVSNVNETFKKISGDRIKTLDSGLEYIELRKKK